MATSSSARSGVLLALAASMTAAGFLVPFQAASARAPRELVVLAMLSVAALLNSVVTLAGRVHGAGRPRPHRSRRLALGVAVLLAALTVIGNFAVSNALGRLGPGLTSVVQQTQLVFVALSSALLLNERISARFALGAGVALAGFALMRLAGGGDSPGAVDVGGMPWAVLSALAFALMHVLTRKVINRIDPVTVNAVRLWMAVGLLLCLPGQARALTALDPVTWALCAAAAFAGPFTARLCLMYAVRHISASRSALLALATPVFAFILGFAAFAIVPGPFEIVGGALILVGIGLPLLERAGAEPPRPDLGVTVR
ncbi:DMT family transporter [Haliangium sp.]|uniref:DMT family transporter n=1 Tax=Haliangium sp. TaxID=2663208 RepID=UPI003D112BD2